MTREEAFMARKTKNKNDRQGSSMKEEQERDALWVRHGIEDVYFQREAQVNFWTVLGGIAVAALLTRITDLFAEIQMGRWHLLFYALTAILLIAASWVQNLWGSIILKMQVRYLYVLLWLMNMVSLSVMCLQVTNPSIFFAACGAVILFTLCFQLYLMKSGAWVVFTAERIKAIKNMLWIYLVFMFLCFAAAAHLSAYPSVPVEIGWGVFALLASTAAVVMHHFSMNRERKEIGIP